ncbi:MAG: glycoside hydrolase family 15 protein [Actinomycetota bacterium]|nr:glycoside hydrolase family 15 protein [Actinomycetota bacterium]
MDNRTTKPPASKLHDTSLGTGTGTGTGYSGPPFPPIADYGLLSDCEATALVSSRGTVEWMCLPRPDSPSVFGAILDRTAGGFRVGPSDVDVPAGRRYLPGTNVLETTWQTPRGWAIVRDVLLIGPWYHDRDRSKDHRRPPTDYEAEGTLLRTVECITGSVDFYVDCEPVFDYGKVDPNWEYTGEAYGEAVARAEGTDLQLKLTTDFRLGFEGRRARARRTLKEGEKAFVALSWSDHAPPPSTLEEAEQRLERTADYWRQWLNRGKFPDHPWKDFVQRSALVLKALIYQPTGAMCAAGTTSLPETPQGERNWDYRYTWIRDSTFMLWALYTLGYDWEANDFFNFVADCCEGEAELQIMYGIGGEKNLEEFTLDHLSGYEDARPVRVGNGAFNQRQHDVWGAVLDSVYLHMRSRDELPERVWDICKLQVEVALKNWKEPDRGIWEVRGEPKHFTCSKVMCWVAAERGARIARVNGDEELEARWQSAAEEIKADVLTNGVDERGAFTQHYDTKALDASNLLIPLMGFLPWDDERVRATVLAIADELTVDELVLRYKVEETDDGLSGEEGTFAICTFWLVSCLVEIGELQRARELLEKMLAFASPLKLFAEEIDVHAARHLGNFPQAFTHLSLINAIMHVIEAEKTSEPGRLM